MESFLELEKNLACSKDEIKMYNEALIKYKNSLIEIKLLFNKEKLLNKDKLNFIIKKIKNILKIPVYLNMAYCYLKKKEWSETISYCNKVLEIDKNNIKAIYRRCKANIGNGIHKIDDAQNDFQHLTTLISNKEKTNNPLSSQNDNFIEDLEKELNKLELERDGNKFCSFISDLEIFKQQLSIETEDTKVSINKIEEIETKEIDNKKINDIEKNQDHQNEVSMSIRTVFQKLIQSFVTKHNSRSSEICLIKMLKDLNLKEKLTIHFSSKNIRVIKLELLKEFFQSHINYCLNYLENKYNLKENKLRIYYIEYSSNLANKVDNIYRQNIEGKYIYSLKKISSYPITFTKNTFGLVFSSICSLINFVKTQILVKLNENKLKKNSELILRKDFKFSSFINIS